MPKDITIKDTQLEDKKVEKFDEKVVEKADAQVKENTENINKADKPLKKDSKIKNWISNLKPWQKILFFSILGALILGTLVFLVFLFVIRANNSPTSILEIEGTYVESSISPQTVLSKFSIVSDTLSKPSVPRTEVSPLNGELFTKDEMAKLLKRRPVAVMVNNHVEGRPQSNLTSADIVFEAVVESGITRYMPIYWSKMPNEVGPIRSARQYYLEWLSEFDPIYIHDGCAMTTDVRTNACGNIYIYGIKDFTTYGAYRTTDRVAPHNEYTSLVEVEARSKVVSFDEFPETIKALKFKRDAKAEDRGLKTRISVRFRTDVPNGGLYDSEFVYDASTNRYLHRIGGQADLDHKTGKQVDAKVVVVMEQTLLPSGDSSGRVIITTIGEGKATILQDGKIINGKWKKGSRTDRTIFYDSKGVELELNRGRLWIISLPRDQGEFDIIEQ